MSAAELDWGAIVLPDRHPPAEFLADVRDVEAAGARTVWTYDHLVWPQLRDSPWYGCVPLLAAAAGVTERVRLGTQVATPNYRHPVTFAKELITLDQLSGGRLEVGVGAGVEGPDALVLGDPPRSRRERSDRFTEWVDLLDRLLREPVVSWQGARYSAVDAHQLPGCLQQPRVPLTVAATGPRALSIAARLGQAWVTYGPYGPQVEPEAWFAALGEQSAALDAAVVAAGRAPSQIRRVAQFALDVTWPFESRQRYADTAGRLAELGFAEVTVHWSRPDGRGLPQRAREYLVEVHGGDQRT